MAMAETMRGAGQPAWPLDPYQVQVTYSASQGISRGTGADWFGPLNPLAPIAPPDVAGRRFDFPPGYNLVQRPRAYEPIGFAELRAFADACDLLRLVIETRKDQVEQLRWTVKPRDPVLRRSSKRPAEMQGRIDAATSFLRRPDGYAGWKAWIRGLLEDMFVIDAATLYCQRTRSGKLVALHQLDGATIKRVIDDWGRTPRPYRGADGAMVYPPAYQQVLKGFPAVNYFDARYHLSTAQHPASQGLRLFAGAAGAAHRADRAAPPNLDARLLHRRIDSRRADWSARHLDC
jgi:hypothetical protein